MCTLLVVDNGSVYTKNLTDFLLTKKIKFTSFSHNSLELSEIPKFTSFILSGRRTNIKQMNALNSKIIKHAVLEKKPLLGICYGAEILALTLGGTIRKTDSLLKGEQEVKIVKDNPICSGKIKVFQSHHYEISRLDSTLSSIGKSENCLYEIVKHNNLNIFGTQFHPEMTKDGQSIIEAFTSIK